VETDFDEIIPFRPAPWCPNGHFHTIGKSLFSTTAKPDCRRIEIPTPDNDFLELDVIDQENSAPVIALFHGLEGSTDRYYMTELMRDLIRKRYSVVGVNFRGCGSRMNRRRRFYHSGETNDYQTVFSWIRERFNDPVIGAVGFSLGGNALVKSLGEEGEHHPVSAAVAVSVPYDLKRGSMVISTGFNRVYEYRFLRTLRKKLDQKRRKYPDLPRFNGSTLYEFDDQVTAKIHGFRDADDYYRRCSSKHFIGEIQRPTLLIHSREDPICPIEAMPVGDIRKNTALDYIITDSGGHVGYWSRPRGWLNQSIVDYLNRQLPDST